MGASATGTNEVTVRQRRFVGRDAELASLTRLLGDAQAARPRLALVHGPPGIGKTMLVERFARSATGARVLWASGDEAETRVPFAMLDQLLRRGGRRTGALGDGPGASEIHDQVSAGSRILELLGACQEDGPVLVVVDDAQWADPQSLRALGFALRRLVADRVLTVVVARTGDLEELPDSLRRQAAFDGAEHLSLPPFDFRELTQLAHSHGLMEFSPRAAQRLREHTEGNPLLAAALLDELPQDTWHGTLARLPAPSSYETMVLGRLTGCEAQARALIEAAAVLGARSRLDQVAAVAGVPDGTVALDDALTSRLVIADRDEVAGQLWIGFAHPLIRAAVLGRLAPGARLGLHRAAAAIVDDERSQLRHRAAATTSSDDDLADELDAFAARETARGAWSNAATSLIEASRLSTVPGQGRRRMLLAIDSMLYHGDIAQASAYEQDVSGFASGPLRDCVLGFAAMMTHRPILAERLLAVAWDAADSTVDPQLRATIARRFALHFLYRLRGRESVDWSRRALALVPGGDGGVLGEMLPLGLGAAYAGDLRSGLREIERAAAGSGEAAAGDGVGLVRARGWLRLVNGELTAARDDLASEAREALGIGAAGSAAFALSMQSRAEYLLGDWDDAAVHAGRAIVITRELDHPFLALAVSSAVAVTAARGDWELAEEQLAMLGEHAEDYEQATVSCAIARAQLASAREAYPDVLRALEPVAAVRPREGVDEPGCWPWPHLWAEALVRSGELGVADGFLAHHERLARMRGRQTAAPRLTRVRAQWFAASGDVERAAQTFSRALEVSEAMRVPLEAATTQLAWGQWLRRRQRRSAARDRLGAARDIYERLGARPFRDRCDAEILGLGLHPQSRRHADPGSLTPQERAVARLVAQGLPNRSVASELVLSIRTVEFHLTHIYAKLGISSRAQLVVALSSPQSGTSGTT